MTNSSPSQLAEERMALRSASTIKDLPAKRALTQNDFDRLILLANAVWSPLPTLAANDIRRWSTIKPEGMMSGLRKAFNALTDRWRLMHVVRNLATQGSQLGTTPQLHQHLWNNYEELCLAVLECMYLITLTKTDSLTGVKYLELRQQIRPPVE